jgi:hypothetical protein
VLLLLLLPPLLLLPHSWSLTWATRVAHATKLAVSDVDVVTVPLKTLFRAFRCWEGHACSCSWWLCLCCNTPSSQQV